MSFYKYTSIPTASIILKNKSLRWSSPLIFNDLEECQFVPFKKEEYKNAYKAYVEILTEYAKGHSLNYNFSEFSDNTKILIQLIRISMNQGSFDNNYLNDFMVKMSSNPESDYNDMVNKLLIKCFRILCLTEQFDNKLMWAHYADQNYGCVIEFERLYIEKPRSLRKGYVRYHENLEPRSNPLDIFLYGVTEEVLDLLIENVVFSKRTSWKYEKEYRLMFAESYGQLIAKVDLQKNKKEYIAKHQPDELYTDVSFPKESIKSLIFGVRSTEKDIKVITELLSENTFNCKLYQMKLKEGLLIKEEIK